MFATGDRVVCINNDWTEGRLEGLGFLSRAVTKLVLALAGPCPLEVGREYSVYHSVPAGMRIEQGGRAVTFTCANIGIGMKSPLMAAIAGMMRVSLPTQDLWPAQWFAKVEKRRTGVAESVAAFRELAEKPQVGVEVDA